MINISYLKFNNISKTYDKRNYALKDFNLEVNKGEFIVVVGPSGSGKSTLLELICGFESLDSGDINLDNRSLKDIEPKDRDVAMVFQNYALMPHLNVYHNIALGMKIRKEKKDIIKDKVIEVAEILDLKDYLYRKPSELSGGQRQRVALGRAMVRNPKLFLMDEPLANLDPKLREGTAREIIRLHKELNGTTIYVTHDQHEALTMADRIVILKDGILQQVGTPREIYFKPNNLFVAEFIGRPEINKLKVKRESNKLLIEEKIHIDLPQQLEALSEGTEYILAFRAEHTSIHREKTFKLKGKVIREEFLGGDTILYLNILNKIIAIKGEYSYKANEEIEIDIDFNMVDIFDIYTKENIRRETNEKNS